METTEKVLRCSFCGKTQNQVKRLIAGPNVSICNECVDLCNNILANELNSDDTEDFDLPKPAQIKHILDSYVVKQESAKKALAVAVYNHYKRINLTRKPTLIMEYFFLPLFVSVIEIGDELSQSAIIRGLDAPVNKTSRHLIKFRKNDIGVLILMILILSIVIFMKVSGWDL